MKCKDHCQEKTRIAEVFGSKEIKWCPVCRLDQMQSILEEAFIEANRIVDPVNIQSTIVLANAIHEILDIIEEMLNVE